jgi:methylphosphotriester-DNA--protein-cysteine methyltransferase
VSPPLHGYAFSFRMLSLLVELLDSRLETPPNSDEIAADVRLPPSHFAAVFRWTIGMTPARSEPAKVGVEIADGTAALGIPLRHGLQ